MGEQANVAVRRLNDRAAAQNIRTPVVVRKGKVKSVTITIPLFEPNDKQGRGKYLVAELPKAIVDDLLRQASNLPEKERSDFIKEWLKKNQEAVLNQYLKVKGKSPKTFRYDVIPVRRVMASTPRRTEQEAAEIPPMAAPRPGTAPTRAPSGPTAKPPSGLRIKRRERPRKPNQVQKGGFGTSDSPYILRMSSVPRKKSGLENNIVEVPLLFKSPDAGLAPFHVEFNFTLNQLADSSIEKTIKEAKKVARELLLYKAFQQGLNLESRDLDMAIKDAVRQTEAKIRVARRKVAAAGKKYSKYLKNN